MSSNPVSDRQLDLDRDLPVTREDVEALRRLRADLPSWFSADWRELEALDNSNAPERRPTANETWAPFSLE